MIPEDYKRKAAKGQSHWLQRDSSVESFIRALETEYDGLEDLTVLDAGCAQGRDTAEIFNYEINARGIDYNPEFIELARRDNPRICFDIGNIEELSYTKEQFEGVYCVNTLFYTDPKRSLPELERVVKRGGIILVTLDEKIVDLDKDEVIHTLDVDKALRYFRSSDVLKREYKEREDSSPFRHIHHFYEVVLKKK